MRRKSSAVGAAGAYHQRAAAAVGAYLAQDGRSAEALKLLLAGKAGAHHTHHIQQGHAHHGAEDKCKEIHHLVAQAQLLHAGIGGVEHLALLLAIGQHDGALLAVLEQEDIQSLADGALALDVAVDALLGGHRAEAAGGGVGLAAELGHLEVGAVEALGDGGEQARAAHLQLAVELYESLVAGRYRRREAVAQHDALVVLGQVGGGGAAALAQQGGGYGTGSVGRV